MDAPAPWTVMVFQAGYCRDVVMVELGDGSAREAVVRSRRWRRAVLSCPACQLIVSILWAGFSGY